MTNGSRLRHVVVLGAEHSGTTILYQMLAFHPRTAWFSQYSMRDGTVAGRRRLPASRTWDRRLRKVATEQWEKRAPRGIERLRPYPQEAAEIWRWLLPIDRDARSGDEPERIRAVLQAHAEATGRRVMLSKAPRLCWEVEPLVEAVPDTRFVHIVRDGRAAVASLIGKYLGDGQPTSTARSAALAHWTEAVAAVRRATALHPVVELRYEDVCVDVHAELVRILTFCGLPVDEFPMTRVPSTLRCTNDERIAELSPDLRASLDEKLAVLLAAYGYA